MSRRDIAAVGLLSVPIGSRLIKTKGRSSFVLLLTYKPQGLGLIFRDLCLNGQNAYAVF